MTPLFCDFADCCRVVRKGKDLEKLLKKEGAHLPEGRVGAQQRLV